MKHRLKTKLIRAILKGQPMRNAGRRASRPPRPAFLVRLAAHVSNGESRVFCKLLSACQ